MAGIAVNVAVIQDGKILLTQRDDFETWILPSGGVEDGESLVQAALRETKEETGLDVVLTGLVGTYTRISNMSTVHAVLFTARMIDGTITCQPGETIAVDWFPFDQIPEPLSAGHKRRIADAISGKRGFVVSQEIIFPSMPAKMTRRDLIEMRDKSGLSRQDFYIKIMNDAILNEKVAVMGS